MEAIKNVEAPKITVIVITIDTMTKVIKKVTRRTKTVTKIAHPIAIAKIAKKTVIVKTVTEAVKNAMTVIIIKVTNIVEILVITKVVRPQVPKTRTRTKKQKKSPNLKTWRPK